MKKFKLRVYFTLDDWIDLTTFTEEDALFQTMEDGSIFDMSYAFNFKKDIIDLRKAIMIRWIEIEDEPKKKR